jgi:predicted nucleic acid-binding protein
MRFIDSNIFVYHMESDPKFSRRANNILSRVEQEEQALTSTLIISQVSSYLKWKKKARFIPVFLDFLQSLPNLSKIETTFLDFVEARKIQTSEEGIPWDDFVIVSQMKRSGINEIYSNDSDFDRIPDVTRFFE